MAAEIRDVTADQKAYLQSVVEEVSRTMNLPACLWLPDRLEQTLRIAAAVGLPAAHVEDAELRFEDVSLPQETFATGELTMTDNLLADPRCRFRAEAQEQGWRSMLCVPIKASGTVLGVLCLYTFVKRQFSEAEVERLGHYAHQVALASDAYGSHLTLGQLLDSMNAVGQSATGSPRDVLRQVARQAVDLAGADCTIVHLDPRDEGYFELEAGIAHHGLLHLPDREEVELVALIDLVLADREEAIYSDLGQEQPSLARNPLVAREGLRALFSQELTVGGSVVGQILVGFRAPQRYSDEELNLFRVFAQQAALAVDGSRRRVQSIAQIGTLKELIKTGPLVAASPGSSRDLRAVLTRIAESGAAAMGADLIDLYLYDEGKREFQLPPVQVGERWGEWVVPETVHEDDVLWDMVRKRRPQYSSDALGQPILTQPYRMKRPGIPGSRFVAREGVRSVAILPLLANARLVGVLFANFRSRQDFPKQQRVLMDHFASQAAMAIGHAWQAYRLRDLGKMVQGLEWMGKRDELLSGFLERAREMLAGDSCGICLLGEPDGKLDCRYHVGKGRQGANGATSPLVQAAARSAKVVRVGDIEPHSQDVGAGEGIRSELGAPIIVGESLVGVFWVRSERVDAFSEEDEHTAQLLANLSGLALLGLATQSRADEAAKQTPVEVGGLYQVYESMMGTGLQASLQAVAEQARSLTAASRGALWLLNRDQSRLVAAGLAGYEASPSELPSIPVDQTSIDGMAVITGRSHLCPDTAQEQRYVQVQNGARSQMVVPLSVNGRNIGTVRVEADTAEAFTPQQLRSLERLSSQAAPAIELGRSIKELEILAEIGQWWAQQQSGGMPVWLRELAELRTIAAKTGSSPRVKVLLRDGRKLEGEWEGLNLLRAKEPPFEVAISGPEQHMVTWIAPASIAEMDVEAGGETVRLILG